MIGLNPWRLRKISQLPEDESDQQVSDHHQDDHESEVPVAQGMNLTRKAMAVSAPIIAALNKTASIASHVFMSPP